MIDAVCQPMGIVHGGVYAAIAETLASMGTAVGGARRTAALPLGMANNTSFLRPVTAGTIHATATAFHRGRTSWIWDVEMRDDDGRLCATSRVHDRGALDPVRSNTDKFKIGFFSFTEITDPAEHRSYNEWHMLDHMPEQYPIAGHRVRAALGLDARVRARRAAVSERAARRRPLPHVLPDDRAGRGDAARVLRSTAARSARSGASISTGARCCRARSGCVDGVAAPRVLVRAESVPFRPHRGIYVVVEAAGAVDTAEHEAALMAAAGVAGLWTFALGRASDAHPWKPGDQRITVAWLDEDPNAVAAAPRAGRTVAVPA